MVFKRLATPDQLGTIPAATGSIAIELPKKAHRRTS
jgi:hypothetical protein